MNKNSRDQVDKAAFRLMEAARDAVLLNVKRSLKTLEIDDKQFERLSSLISSSFEEGFHRNFLTFTKMTDEHITRPIVSKKDKA